MDIQLFATDEELQDFPESKTDSSTVQDKTPSPKSINLTASDLPRSHSDLPKISSRLPERKSKRKSRRDHRRKSRSNTRSKNCIVGHLAAQTNDQLDTKQEIQWVIRPTHETYLDQLVGHPVGPPPLSEAALPSQPVLSPLETAPPVAHQPILHQPMVHQPILCQPVVRQPGRPVPSLLSLHLQPDLNVLARTLSPQALRYVHLGIQIGQNLLN